MRFDASEKCFSNRHRRQRLPANPVRNLCCTGRYHLASRPGKNVSARLEVFNHLHFGRKKQRLCCNCSFKNLLYIAEAKGKALLPIMQPLPACITAKRGYRMQKFGEGACRHKRGVSVICCMRSFLHFSTLCIWGDAGASQAGRSAAPGRTRLALLQKCLRRPSAISKAVVRLRAQPVRIGVVMNSSNVYPKTKPYCRTMLCLKPLPISDPDDRFARQDRSGTLTN